MIRFLSISITKAASSLLLQSSFLFLQNVSSMFCLFFPGEQPLIFLPVLQSFILQQQTVPRAQDQRQWRTELEQFSLPSHLKRKNVIRKEPIQKQTPKPLVLLSGNCHTITQQMGKSQNREPLNLLLHNSKYGEEVWRQILALLASSTSRHLRKAYYVPALEMNKAMTSCPPRGKCSLRGSF